MTPIESLLQQRTRFLQFVRRRVDSPAVAEDLLQAAYLRALEQPPALESDDSAVAWFYRVLRNAIIDLYRRRSAEDRALGRWAEDILQSPDPHPETQQIACGCIDHVITTLKPSYQQILRDVDLAEASLDSFARQHAITPGNAAVRIHRARHALRKQLTVVCGSCAEHACIDCTCRQSALPSRAQLLGNTSRRASP